MSSTKVSPLRIVLLGKSGSGKSTSGNTILGRGIFKKWFSVKSVTETCSKLQSEVGGRKIALIDTPGFIYTEEKSDKREKEVKKCVKLSLPGPHAFLLVIRMDERFTEEERNAVKWIQENFGEEALKYTIVLLTHGDASEEPVEDFLRKRPSVSCLIEDVGGRHHVFNNDSKDRTQVRVLKRKIEAMVQENGGGYYKVASNLEARSKAARESAERINAAVAGFAGALGAVVLGALAQALAGVLAATVASAGAGAAIGAAVTAAGAVIGAGTVGATVGAAAAAVGTAVGAGVLAVGATTSAAVGTSAEGAVGGARGAGLTTEATQGGPAADRAGTEVGLRVVAGAGAVVGAAAVAGAVAGGVGGALVGSIGGRVVATVVAGVGAVVGAVLGTVSVVAAGALLIRMRG